MDVSRHNDCRGYYELNLTNELLAITWAWSPLEDLFFTVVLPCIMLIGFIGNFSFLFAVIRVRLMQTLTNAYLANVAFADFMFVVYTCSIYLATYLVTPVRNDVLFGSGIGCSLSYGFTYLCYFASLILITLVTVERYFAVCRPFQHRSVSGKSRTTKMIIASWLFSLIFMALTILRHTGYVTYCVNWPETENFLSFPKLIQFCDTIHPDVYILSEVCQTGPFFIAMVINLFMYSRIVIALSNRPSAVSGSESSQQIDSQQHQTTRVRNQVARLLIINGTIFFLSQSPYRILSINNILQHATGVGFFDKRQYGMLLVVSRCLILLNSCVNPIVYYTTSEFYRRGFKQAFGWMKEKQHKNDSSQTKSTVASNVTENEGK